MPNVRSSSLSVTFGASHQIQGDPVCSRLHGHQYTVTAHWSDTALPDVAMVRKVIEEFSGLHLNDMIPAAPPTVEGLAGYLSERMSMMRVDRVEVHESDTGRGASVQRLPG